MKIVVTFLSLVFAIYAAVRGVGFIQSSNNKLLFFGICYLLLSVGLAYITVKLALKKKSS